MKKGSLIKAVVVGKWLTTPTPPMKGVLKAIVWIPTLLIMISVAFRIGKLFTFSIFAFVIAYIAYFGLAILRTLKPWKVRKARD